MVVITDGGDTHEPGGLQGSPARSPGSEAIIYSIIIVPIEASAGRDTGGEHALIQISSDTGGKYYYAKSLPQLDDAFRQISDELRTQYLLAYYPPKIARDDFRKISLEVIRQGRSRRQASTTSHYRTGYYTSKLK
jgi:Ca-activated chloride channel family protein